MTLRDLINKTVPVPMVTVMYQCDGRGNKNINDCKTQHEEVLKHKLFNLKSSFLCQFYFK